MDDQQGMVDQGPLPWSAMSVVRRAPVRMFTYRDRPQDSAQYIGPVIANVPELEGRANPRNVLGMDQHSFIGVLWGACNELLNMIEPLQEVAGDLSHISAASTSEHQRLQSEIDTLHGGMADVAGAADVDDRLAAVWAEMHDMESRVASTTGGLDATQHTQDTQLQALQAWSTQYETDMATTLDTFRSTLNALAGRVGVLESWRTSATNRLDATEAADAAAKTRLDAVEALDRAQGTRLDVLETQRGATAAQLTGMQTTVDNARASAEQAGAAAASANTTANTAQATAATASSTATAAQSAAAAAQSGVSALQTRAGAMEARTGSLETRATALEARVPRLWQAVGNLPTLALGATADVVCTWLTAPSTVPTVGQCAPIVGPTLGSTTAPTVKAVTASTVTVTVKAGLAVTATTGGVSVVAATF